MAYILSSHFFFSFFFWPKQESDQVQVTKCEDVHCFQRNNAPHMITDRNMWYILLYFFVINSATINTGFPVNSTISLNSRAKKEISIKNLNWTNNWNWFVSSYLLFVSSQQCFDHWYNKCLQKPFNTNEDLYLLEFN